MTVAAVDIGTNTATLVVMSSDGVVLDHVVTVTGLGRGLATSGVLHDDDIERALGALAGHRTRAERQGAAIVAAAVTDVGRRSADIHRFLDAAEGPLGIRPAVIDAAGEARLSWIGALGDLDAAAPGSLVAVVDIGGGSSEIALGDPASGEPRSFSMPIGSLRLAGELRHDPPRPDELTNAIGLALDHLDDAVRHLPDLAEAATVVGVAGTIVTVAAIEIGLAEWDERRVHGFRLTRAAAEDVFRTLATESAAQRVHNPGLPADRADVIVGGCCALVAVMRRLQLDEIVVSARGVAHGLAVDTLRRAAGGAG